MIAKVLSSGVVGIDACPIEVEVEVGSGLPSFGIVGLPDTACRESQERVRSAIRNSGYSIPMRKVTVNLAPAGIKKEGAFFDLPIAIGILAASEQIPSEALAECVVAGELALDGKVRAITGILSRITAAPHAGKKFIFPQANLREAACVEGARLYPVRHLCEAVSALAGEGELDRASVKTGSRPAKAKKYDFADVKGQMIARRGIEIAVAGGHNLLMIGPPGGGKTMLAKRIPTILADLNFEEAVETTKIHSVAGLLKTKEGLIEEPPFRAPHHTVSDAGMVGGGTCPRPGEISLAHNGILFLDELPEFRRNVLEALRQPLEEGQITVTRAALSLKYPAQFMLVAAMNPCPCGYFTDPNKDCFCSPIQIRNYLGKVSGPLLDRIDIHLHVGALKPADFESGRLWESSGAIRARIESAREKQCERYGDRSMLNSRLEGKEAETFCAGTDEASRFLREALETLGFSGRAYHKTLKIARTIADLESKPLIGLTHVQEAIQYRVLDRASWLN